MKIIYTTGDLLKSNTEALVNTVNCEGYMGKGIAYQFKLKFPLNNEDYIKACKSGELTIGKVHHYIEHDKIIINFPTKDKWRANSKIEYIDKGLDSLISLINELNIQTISIPPLGSGNGGLIWSDVKKLIEKKFSVCTGNLEVIIFEPSQNYIQRSSYEPKLSPSGLVLMRFKQLLNKFNTLRLQKAAYFMDVFSDTKYFNFKRHKYGPYDNSISIISRSIKEFQQYHNVKNIDESYTILYNKLISDTTINKLSLLDASIIRACKFVNLIESDHELECLSTVVYLVQEKGSLPLEDIIKEFKMWSEDKALRFSENEIQVAIEKMYDAGVFEKNLIGYQLSNIR